MKAILSLGILVLSSCQWTAEKAPQNWVDWKTKASERFQEKFASPTITHHIYLESENDRAYLNLAGAYPRLQKEACEGCFVKVERGQDLKAYVNSKGMTEKSELEPEKPTPFLNSDRYYLSAYPSKEENKIRIFVHDLQQKDLAQKRQRQFFNFSEKWQMQATWKWLPSPQTVKIHRSDGSDKEMQKVAELTGQLQGKDITLSVFDFESNGQYKEEDKAMLLFRDQSNGKSTYGAGRFLNVEFSTKIGQLKDTDKVMVDFNYSYNPPCAVSTGFHCPLPIDTASVAIEAGEKYSKSH